MSFSSLSIATHVTPEGVGQIPLLFKMHAPSDLNFLYPLSEFYRQSGLPLPSASRVEGRDIPEPWRSLLVHESDMTPTIEAAYGRSVSLRVLRCSVRRDGVSRQVALVLDHDSRAVVFGAITIHLEQFPAEARQLVLEGKTPLGTILHQQGMPHKSRPAAYFQVTADPVIREVFRLAGSPVLYGRQNVLSDSSGHTLAQVVEILPPSGQIEGLEGGRE